MDCEAISKALHPPTLWHHPENFAASQSPLPAGCFGHRWRHSQQYGRMRFWLSLACLLVRQRTISRMAPHDPLTIWEICSFQNVQQAWQCEGTGLSNGRTLEKIQFLAKWKSNIHFKAHPLEEFRLYEHANKRFFVKKKKSVVYSLLVYCSCLHIETSQFMINCKAG